MSRFDPRKHPRWPAGTPEHGDVGPGQFRERSGGWADTASSRLAVDPGFDRVRQILATPLKKGLSTQRGGSMASTHLEEREGGNLIQKHYPHGERKIAREVAASHVGRALGLPVPAAVIDPDHPDTLHMEYADARIAEHTEHAQGWFPTQDAARSRQGLAVGFFDALVSNGDRHTGNWLVGPGGELIPIDHGEAMDTLWDDPKGTKPKRFKHVGFSQPYMTVPGVEYPDSRWRDSNPLHPDDVPVVRARLVALEPVFREMGINREYANMMARFEALAQRAGGTERLFT